MAKLQLRYRCCWLWLDAEQEALDAHLTARVGDMLQRGLLAEVESLLRSGDGDGFGVGLRQAIGASPNGGCDAIIPHHLRAHPTT